MTDEAVKYIADAPDEGTRRFREDYLDLQRIFDEACLDLQGIFKAARRLEGLPQDVLELEQPPPGHVRGGCHDDNCPCYANGWEEGMQAEREDSDPAGGRTR